MHDLALLPGGGGADIIVGSAFGQVLITRGRLPLFSVPKEAVIWESCQIAMLFKKYFGFSGESTKYVLP